MTAWPLSLDWFALPTGDFFRAGTILQHTNEHIAREGTGGVPRRHEPRRQNPVPVDLMGKSKSKESSRGRPEFEPTDKQRGEVEALSVAGFTQDEIAAYLDVDPKTLRLHFRREIDTSLMRTIAHVVGNVLRFAIGAAAQYDETGNCLRAEIVPQAWAMCFFLKTRGKRQGWTERVEHTGKDGGPIEFDLSGLSDDELDIVERARNILARCAPAGALVGGEGQTTH